MKHPILYSFRRCPYAMRARLAIYKSGIAVKLREIELRDKPAHMLEISPKGTVPVLQLTDGTVIEESLDIMLWALNQNDPDNWLSHKDDALITQNDTDFKHALDRYKYPNRYPDEERPNLQQDMFDRAAVILKGLNERIKQNGTLSGPQNGFTDYAIFPFIRQFANVDRSAFQALELSALEHWLNEHLESALFQTIMEKHPIWTADEHG